MIYRIQPTSLILLLFFYIYFGQFQQISADFGQNRPISSDFGQNRLELTLVGVNRKKKKSLISVSEECRRESGVGAAPILPHWCFRGFGINFFGFLLKVGWIIVITFTIKYKIFLFASSFMFRFPFVLAYKLTSLSNLCIVFYGFNIFFNYNCIFIQLIF